MANAIYDLARQAFLSQSPSIDLDTDTIKAMLVKTAQSFSQAHQYVSDLTGSNIVARSAGLSGKSVTAGVFDATDVTFTAPTTGQTCLIVIYKDDSSVDASSPLIAWLDTGTGFPVVTSGGDVTIVWDNTSGVKIFKI